MPLTAVVTATVFCSCKCFSASC